MNEIGIEGKELPARLPSRRPGVVEAVDVAEVLYVKGADNYVELVRQDGSRALHDGTMTGLEHRLAGEFCRIHRSYLVRVSAIRRLHVRAGSRCRAELANGERLPVGRTRSRELWRTLFR